MRSTCPENRRSTTLVRFKKPTNWDAEHKEQKGDCEDLIVRIDKEAQTCTSAWLPTDAELAALNAGKPICITITGEQPPIMVHVE